MQGGIVAGLSDVNTIVMCEKTLLFHRDKKMGVNGIANMGVQGFVVVGNSKIIDLAEKDDIFMGNGGTVEAWCMGGGVKAMLAENGVNVLGPLAWGFGMTFLKVF